MTDYSNLTIGQLEDCIKWSSYGDGGNYSSNGIEYKLINSLLIEELNKRVS